MNSRDIEALFGLLQNIDDKLGKLVQATPPPGKAVSVEFYEVIDRREVRLPKMEAIKSGMKKLLKVKYKDAAGRDAVVDGAPKWQANVEGAVSLAPAADGLSCEMVVLDAAPLGVFKVQVVADADMTPDGVEELIGEIEFQVVSGKAVIVELTAEDVP
jgi:hypothetical protein